MDSISIKAVLSEVSDGFKFIPATNADKQIASIFTSSSEMKYVTITMKYTKSTKSYKQLKTAWALITIIFKSMWGRKPTEKERQEFYEELIEEYSDRKPSLLHPGKTVPVTFSEMSDKQLSTFIKLLINMLAENCDLSADEQIEVKDLFSEWEDYCSSLEADPNDLDDNGNYLPIDIWREQHPVSFASGLGGPLDLAHIVTRGADEEHRDCCWNVMMLTHEEHMKQHEIGWNNFCNLYPHLRGRVERAKKLAGRKSLEQEALADKNLYKRRS